MRKKRIVLQIPVAYNGITSCVVTLREMEKKFFDILRIVQKNPVFGKTLMCGGMLDEKRMEILYEILYAIDRGEIGRESYMRFSMRLTGGSLRIPEMTSFSMAV